MVTLIFLFLSSFAASAYARATLLGHWTFEPGDELKDLTGHFSDVALVKSAHVEGGSLETGANGWAIAKSYTGPSITEKTLVSWVYINSFDPRGGSVLTIDKIDRDEFDAIVLGETRRGYWLAGSSFHRRTKNIGYHERTLNKLIQIAITYRNVNGVLQVSIFRNGKCVVSFKKGVPITWTTGNTEIFWGIRHGTASNGGPGKLNVRIEESRIYSGVLSSSDLINLCPSKGRRLNLIGQFTFEKGDKYRDEYRDLMGNFAEVTLKGASISNGQLDVGFNKWAISPNYKGPCIYEKTLVSWVSIDSFSHQKGSALTIDKKTSDQFDGIVLGERMANHWMSGSSFFLRTSDAIPGFKEQATNKMVQLAISYENDNGFMHVKLYRNGKKFGDYIKGKFVKWPTGDAELFWGKRHGSYSGGPGNLDAHIEESRIYAEVLTGEDLKQLEPKKGKCHVNLASIMENEEDMDDEDVDDEPIEETPADDYQQEPEVFEESWEPASVDESGRDEQQQAGDRLIDLDYLEESMEEKYPSRW